MRRLLVLALLFAGHAPVLSPARMPQRQAPPAKSPKPPQKQTELEKLVAERDRLMKEQKYKEALPVAQRVVGILREEKPGSLAFADALHQLGRIDYSQRDLASAEAAWTEALTIREKLTPGSLDVAASLDNLGIVAAYRGELAEAQRRFEAALAIRQKLDPGSLAVAKSLNNLGYVAADRGDLAEAQRQHEAALAIRQKLDPGSLDVAASLDNLGNVAYEYGDLEEAQRRFEAALAICEKLAPGSLDTAASLGNLGNVAYERGDLEEAQHRFEAALAIREKLAPGSLDVAITLNSLGNVAAERGDLAEAQRRYEAALAIREKFAPGSLAVASSLSSLGTIAGERGDLAEAQRRYEAALAIREKFAPGSLAVASSLYNLGNVAHDHGDLAEAQRRYEAALSIRERLAPGSLDVGQSLNNLGVVAHDRGDLVEAQRRYEAALAIREKLAPGSLDVADSLINLGVIASVRRDLEGAQRRFEAALAIQLTLAPGSIYVANSLNNLCFVARVRGDDDALNSLGTRWLDLAANLVVAQGVSRPSELGSFASEASNALDRIGWLKDPSPFYAYLPTLRAAGLTLETRAKISEREAEGDESVRKARSAVQIATKQETDWATNPRPKELDDKAWNDELLELRSARQSAELKLATLLKEKDPRLATDLKVNLEDVQKNLTKDAALVEYLRVSTWDDKAKKVGQDAYGAFIVNRQGPVKFVRLGDAEEIDKLVADFMARVNADSSADRAQPVGPAPRPTEGKSREELGKELYRKLIARLGKLPANLQIAPDSSLHGLAFDALQDARGRYLLELKSVSLVGSGRDLAVRPPTAPAGPAVVFGVGTFQADLAARERPVAAKTEPSTAATRGQRGGSVWGSLPGAVEEAREVASRLGVEPILDSQAIEERLIGVKNPSVLHLATHGFSFPPAFEAPKRDRMEGLSLGERFGSADNPMLRSGIVLSGANDEEKLRAAGYLDGWVTALDLSLMDLRGTELVVLSACDTGLGDVRQSEGVFGLQRALRFAGAQTLVMSLFEVPDASTASLMKDFYGAWRPGSAPGTKQSALRAAKLKLLKDPKTRSPKNWAGFVLLGDR